MDDLMPQNIDIQVVVNYIKEDNVLFSKYDFKNIGVFVDRENETVFQSFSFKTTWQTGALNDVIKAIADDEVRAFIIAEGHLIAPYGGGVDLISKKDYPLSIFT